MPKVRKPQETKIGDLKIKEETLKIHPCITKTEFKINYTSLYHQTKEHPNYQKNLKKCRGGGAEQKKH